MITEEKVLEALKTVEDPEIGIDVVNLGFIYDVKIAGEQVIVAMTLTMKGCPLHASLKQSAASAVVNIVFDPPWNPNMMSAWAKDKLGFSPDMLA